VVDGRDLVIAVRKRQFDDLLDSDTVVRKKDFFRHGLTPLVWQHATTVLVTGQEITDDGALPHLRSSRESETLSGEHAGLVRRDVARRRGRLRDRPPPAVRSHR